LPIEGLYRAQLEAGSTAPIQEAAFGSHLDTHDHWVLCGIPSQTVEYDGETRATARLVSLPLQRTNPPETAGQKALIQFYAKLTDLGFVTDIVGMSGGPIFALKKSREEWRYTLIGVQSAWYESLHVIAGCPIALVRAALKN